MPKNYSNFDSSYTLGLKVMKSQITLGLFNNCKSMSNFPQKNSFHFVKILMTKLFDIQ
jgi:hypothetical protein